MGETRLKLVRNFDGERVEIGAILTSSRGEQFVVTGMAKPHKLGSTGRVFVASLDPDPESREFFPSVFDCSWEVVRGTL